MPSFGEILHYFSGVWLLMWGRSEGLSRLDLSVDGFWRSFSAVLVALPVLLLAAMNDASSYIDRAGFLAPLPVILRLALATVLAWLVTYALFALTARHIGLGERMVHYIVAGNWATALLAWLLVPVHLLSLVFALDEEAALLLLLPVSLALLVFDWRLTNTVLDKGPAMATAVFLAVLVLSLVLGSFFQSVLGLARP